MGFYRGKLTMRDEDFREFRKQLKYCIARIYRDHLKSLTPEQLQEEMNSMERPSALDRELKSHITKAYQEYLVSEQFREKIEDRMG